LPHFPAHPACSNKDCTGVPEGVRVLTIPNVSHTPWEAINAGIRAMTTDYFTWLSSDDILYPNKVARQLQAMRATGSQASFHGYDVLLGENAKSRRVIMPMMWQTPDEAQRVLARGCVINGLTVMLHKSVFERCGLFDESEDFSIVSDWEYWNRVAADFMWLPINEVLAIRRDYDNASTRYAEDPEKREKWIAEDQRVRALYAPRCPRCDANEGVAP
jgi:hypothetical protein